MADQSTAHLQRCLERLRAGDSTARAELLNSACERLQRLTHKMLQDYPRVRRWEETGDVCQNALIRLCRTLETISPESVRDFYRLAALQVRRELIDLARSIAALPINYQPELETAYVRVVDAVRRRRRILALVQEALSQLRLDIKYLMFDLDMTRKERDALRERLGDQA